MKIEYVNIPNNSSKFNFALRYIFNKFRTWYLFSIRFKWVKYSGFVRVMKGTSFARMNIQIGNNVQFGEYCNVANNVIFGNYILMAGRVCFVGKHDHPFDTAGQYIWHGSRDTSGFCTVEDDVWIGHNSTIVGNIKIERGSIIAAGSVVINNIPPCEIWGGVPAKKIRNRFQNDSDKLKHLHFLDAQLKTFNA
ncbi:acyltransferase [Runella sp. SP2]|uniref:acyltransferase n=1 Tax=Runella sp. SP2 TaxID=2268026 RepID=UPI000F09813E|nr:acyltransferase [Runella sp. SP2]AYQ31766.1 acyltransferase [Runella sp. SP2]